MSNHDSATPPALPQSLPPPLPSAPDGIWFVVTRGGVISMTLDQLDDAFHRGEVSAGTRVFTSGMDTWETLGVLAQLDDAGACEAWHPTPPLTQPTTGVQRSPGRLPFPVRRALAQLLDGLVSLGSARRRLAVFGIWALGTALWLVFLAVPPRSAAVPVPSQAAAATVAPSQPTPEATAPPLRDEAESIPVVQANQLRPAPPAQEPATSERTASATARRAPPPAARNGRAAKHPSPRTKKPPRRVQHASRGR